MASLYITEYVRQAVDRNGQPIAAGMEPAIAEQKVAIGGTSTASSALNALTTFVMLHTDAICSVQFGTAPTATASLQRLAANETRFYGVEAGKSIKVAVITNS